MPIEQFNKQELPAGFSTTHGFFKVDQNDDGIQLINMTCPHRGGPLTHATDGGNYLICPWHKRKCSKIKLQAQLMPTIMTDKYVFFILGTRLIRTFQQLPITS